MPSLHFITHPEVIIDPSVPVPDWPLSPEGLRRMGLALEQPWMTRLAAVFSSAERKAMDAARLVGDHFGLSPVIIAELGENNRSATGYLPKAEFEATADLFFAHPERSVRGWERAVEAQRRIVAAVERVITQAPGHGDVAVISHGGVGALLLCHLKGMPISRTEDQPGAGGGCVYSFDVGTRGLLSGWRRIEDREVSHHRF
jgi:broad specificity phosphatase PhoE